MIISQSELFQKISTALLHLKSKAADKIETAGTIGMLENTLNLLSAASIQLNIDEFPTDAEDCQALINNAENGLSESDLEALEYLSESVRWALDAVS